MSFTDGKPRAATAEEVAARWNGRQAGQGFRCRLCGYRFKVGDIWRFVLANYGASPLRHGNFFTCEKCDGPDIIERAAAQEAEAAQRFWWLLEEE